MTLLEYIVEKINNTEFFAKIIVDRDKKISIPKSMINKTLLGKYIVPILPVEENEDLIFLGPLKLIQQFSAHSHLFICEYKRCGSFITIPSFLRDFREYSIEPKRDVYISVQAVFFKIPIWEIKREEFLNNLKSTIKPKKLEEYNYIFGEDKEIEFKEEIRNYREENSVFNVFTEFGCKLDDWVFNAFFEADFFEGEFYCEFEFTIHNIGWVLLEDVLRFM